MTMETEYVKDALEAIDYWRHLLPTDTMRKVNLALSLIKSNGSPTYEEMVRELGTNWVIARRTKNIVAKYGESVKCITAKQYEAAERRAIEKRF